MPEENKAEPAANADESSGNEVGSMKGGDYCIHVYIQSGKNFKSAHDMIDPMIQVTCCDIKKYSASKSNVPTGTDTPNDWSEHMFFEPRNQIKQEIEEATISIRVLNKGLFRDDLVGCYDFDITFVYFKDKHTIQHQWIALSNPESDDCSEITGYLKLSINVQGPDDEQVQLIDQTGADSNEEVMMPASIKKDFKQLIFRFIHAEQLPQMDMFGSIDAYFKTEFMGKKSRTKAVTQKKGECPIQQEIWLPLQWPISSDRLVFKVYDEDTVIDEIVCSMKFSLKQLVANASAGGYFYWQNLYGAPKEGDGDSAKMMKENNELASAWKGRVLMNIEVADSKHPEKKVIDLDPKIKKQALDLGFFDPKEYEIIADVGMGVQLPGKEKYKIKIVINDFEIETQAPKESRESYCRWHERLTKKFKSVQRSIDAMDTIFVYLMDGKVPICFWKGKVSEFKELNPNYRWLGMKADKSLDKVENDYDAGLISIKLSIVDITSHGEQKFTDYEAWKKPPPRRLNAWKVRAHIFQCRDIPAADEDGACDPFISIWNPDAKEIKTKSIPDNLNPIFYEVLEVYYDYDNLANAPPIILNVWDHDEGELYGSSKDYLGRAVIYLKDCEFATDDTIMRPQWQDIKLGFDESSPPSGQVLVSFSVVPDDHDWIKPTKYVDLNDVVETSEFTININVLGLRDLQSFGLMPIKKPFVKFRVKSLLPPDKAQAVTNVQTDPNASGPNPNINTMITLSVLLPMDKLYCPRLSCDAYDYIYKGFSQPLIGTFTIPVGDVLHESLDNKATTLAKAAEIIRFLQERSCEDQQLLKERLNKKTQAKEENLKAYKGSKTMKQPKPVMNKQDENPFDKKKSVLKPNLGVSKSQSYIKNGSYAQLEDEPDIESQIQGKDSMFQQELQDRKSIAIEIDDIEVVKDQPLQSNADIDAQMNQVQLTVKSQSKKSKGSRKSQAISSKAGTIEKKKIAADKQKEKLQRKATLKDQKSKDKQAMKDAGVADTETILCPKYEFIKALNYYVEYDFPPETIYQAVGFNDLKTVNIMMDGDDEEKRDPGKQQAVQRKSTQHSQRLNTAEMEMQNEIEEDNETARRLDLTKKHYRKYYDDELENDKEIFPKMPFHRFDIMRGQSRGLKKSWTSFLAPPKLDESGQVTNEKVVGYFKGRISVFNEEREKKFNDDKNKSVDLIISSLLKIHKKMYGRDMEFNLEMLESQEGARRFGTQLENMDCEHPDLIEFLQDQSYEELIKRQLVKQTSCTVEVYVLEGFDLASRDIGSFSDPFLKVTCGSKSYNSSDDYFLDEPNPKFNVRYQFGCDFPGAPPMIVEAYDFDDLFGDDLIGRTVVDLDDRFFSPDWQAMEEKPIEWRQIYHESTSLSQGVIKMWVEIEANDKEAKKAQKVWDVTPEAIRDYQLRLSVFNTENLPCVDAEGCTDAYIVAYIDDKDKKETDTHYRCSSGKASFNYRLLYDIKAPRKNYLLVIQAFDRDLFSSNDYICEWTLDLEEIFMNVRMTQTQTVINKKFYDSYFKDKLPKGVVLEFEKDDTFWMTTEKDGQKIKCRFDLRLFPGDMAEANPVGKAREESNFEPYLPPPVGRISFSLNPFTMLSQMVGPAMLRKIYCYCVLILCCGLCIAMLPMIFSNLISSAMMSMLGMK